MDRVQPPNWPTTELNRLTADNKRLRAALDRIADDEYSPGGIIKAELARAALAEREKDD